MSSALQLSPVNIVRPNDSVTLIMLTAVGYDYILTFPNELQYIWSKPWTRVSILFILVRYVGLFCLIASSVVGSSFLPGPTRMYVLFLTLFPKDFLTRRENSCQILVITNNWAFCLFFGAADFLMMLRVWALYNRSRFIFTTLLALFFLEVINIVIPTAIFSSNPTAILDYHLPAVAIQTLSCPLILPPISTIAGTILQIINGVVMCTLAVVRFVTHSLQTYRITRQLQPNRYMTLIVEQGILYFFVTFLRMANILHILAASRDFPMRGWQLMLLAVIQYVPMFTLIPRFTMSIRELYARDIKGDDEGIDDGFGLASSVPDADETIIVFASLEQTEGLECIEEMEGVDEHAMG